ncbi:MAG: hypothetical protein UX31_C0001G0050 [Candidatus Nomurabacteria bacterium GW2011_GWA1_46_11]|uniref:Zinc-finger domain-containing protein n=2 Tax=Parcubacteria group TaxID=1794811 RepID=A0A1F8F066_9BACT|nr:MAG: hypothetical protein UX31_C0001G0050 [Candidatus Nomurabacteria bacterium GW2011_GWA1_46_11]OGN06078.1 MAG: hypothetical protein A2669_00935 [Candidatus Yanofskybacteria bacterium RIFCSPHIGHO2_01_FULL_48_25b]
MAFETNPKIRAIKRRIEKPTPEVREFGRLLERESLHPKDKVIERWVKFPKTFNEEESKMLEQHLGFCKQCSTRRDNIMPLLEEQAS